MYHIKSVLYEDAPCLKKAVGLITALNLSRAARRMCFCFFFKDYDYGASG